ncbi:MAG TPA: M3 family metallopeptidase, partial [Candidatus Eisenbacteria bacterium]|nr:M3 family metallopeptidase [Candidatus Eisenbacteria bacterium]
APHAAPHAAAVPDGAPFWTGHPDAAQFKARMERHLARARASLATLLAAHGPRTLANTLRPYDEILRQVDMSGSQSGLIEEVSPDSATRAAAEATDEETQKFVTDLSLNRKVYDALAALDVSRADAETRYYVQKTLRDFRLAGVDKDDATRARIKTVNDELVPISQAFGRNIREDHTTVACTAAELDGLPQDYIDRHKPDADGRITLGIEYPDAIPVFTYAKNDDLRKRMYMAYQNRAFPRNIAVLDSMREKRHELAQLVGYPDWADYVMADKMVGNATNARDFIARVVAASADRQAREYRQLLARKQKDDPAATAVQFWETQYYSEQVRKTDFNFDSQSIRPYLPYDRVEQGVLDVAAKLFGVEFKRVPGAPVWDPSVECYELWDGGRLAGRFYLDMHPRPNKYNHAAQFDIRTGVEGVQVPEAALICNLPGGQPGDPGLCEIDDVNTFFHEFGHLLHNMFAGHHRWVGTGGIRTEQDFVEAPSQMLEEWMRSPEVLASFAKHYQTGQPIPAELVKQMNRANDFGKGLQVRRQMVYAGVSLGCYDRDPATISSDSLFSSLVREYQPFPFVDGTHFQCSFGHLDGYSAVYYTYMWSLVIAKDMFAQFDRDHLLAPGVAKRYRLTVLAPGGSMPAAQLVHNFLGRDFDERNWKKWLDSDD